MDQPGLYTKHFVGVLSYLLRLKRDPDDASILWDGDVRLNKASFPYENWPVAAPENNDLFETASMACGYLATSMTTDLYRRFPAARRETIRWHVKAK